MNNTLTAHHARKRHRPANTTALRVHLWTVGMLGPRELQLNLDGWSRNPRTQLVEDPKDAQLIVWLATMTRHERELAPPYDKPTVLLDYADGCTAHGNRHKLKQARGRLL